jgi:beta-lactamase regulating signal transducer with metallopeptidase domain
MPAISDNMTMLNNQRSPVLRQSTNLVRDSTKKEFSTFLCNNAPFLIWLLGVSVFILLCLIRHIRFVRHIRRWSREIGDSIPHKSYGSLQPLKIQRFFSKANAEFNPSNESRYIELTALLDAVCATANLHCRPKLYLCPLVTTPLMMGLFQPVFILPDNPIRLEQLRFMLLHEIMHYKRGDAWAKLFSLVATAAHWFNPLVWLMNRCFVSETELACDAAVLRNVRTEHRVSYGETVLHTARRGCETSTMLVSACSGGGKNLKRRLINIVEYKSVRKWVDRCCATVILFSLILTVLSSFDSSADAKLSVPIIENRQADFEIRGGCADSDMNVPTNETSSIDFEIPSGNICSETNSFARENINVGLEIPSGSISSESNAFARENLDIGSEIPSGSTSSENNAFARENLDIGSEILSGNSSAEHDVFARKSFDKGLEIQDGDTSSESNVFTRGTSNVDFEIPRGDTSLEHDVLTRESIDKGLEIQDGDTSSEHDVVISENTDINLEIPGGDTSKELDVPVENVQLYYDYNIPDAYWSITGNNSAETTIETTIDQNGILTVAYDETADVIVATCSGDTSIYGKVYIFIIYDEDERKLEMIQKTDQLWQEAQKAVKNQNYIDAINCYDMILGIYNEMGFNVGDVCYDDFLCEKHRLENL